MQNEFAIKVINNSDKQDVYFQGILATHSFNEIKKNLEYIVIKKNNSVNLDFSALEQCDSNVFWLLRQWMKGYPKNIFKIKNLKQKFQKIYNTLPILNPSDIPPPPIKQHKITNYINQKLTVIFSVAGYFLQIVMLKNPANNQQKKLFWHNFLSNIQEMGVRSLPVFTITMFFLGLVITLQGATQLRTFSAELYAVDFLALSVFRELGPIITGILLASRTGSAITTQISTMKASDEIKMLEVMGINPLKIILLPKIAALVVISPFLTLFSCFVATLGGMLVFVFNMKYSSLLFFNFLQLSMSYKSFWMFAWKGPLFAFCIGLISCTYGLLAKPNSIDIGKKTTAAVVVSLVTVLVLDGIISVISVYV